MDNHTKAVHCCTCTLITHLPVIALPSHNVYARGRCIVKNYHHICGFEVNVGELFTANKKRGECGNAFKVVNHRGQLGHLQSKLVDPLWARYRLVLIIDTTRIFAIDHQYQSIN